MGRRFLWGQRVSNFPNYMSTFPIPRDVIDELIHAGLEKDILNPEQVFEIGYISAGAMTVIGANSLKVYVSKKALKHIIDRRGSAEIIYLIPGILSNPTKITDNSFKRQHSFILAKMNGRYRGVVLEITKTPDYENQVVSAFIIDPKTYKKMSDISGGAAP